MTWQHYEVWSVNEDGHEDLIDTTGSLTEAKRLAESTLTDYYPECIIYQENDDGDLLEVERIHK